MQNKRVIVLIGLCLSSLMSCAQNSDNILEYGDVVNQKKEAVKTKGHPYGAWYCPDNLNGFPAVDIKSWKKVPVVNGRMPTKEETQNGTSLIFVDAEKYPNAKVLDISMPQLATLYNEHSSREEIIIVIQAINIDNDSIVGFRYLNGGNGSARLNEIRFITDDDIELTPSARFVSIDIEINANAIEVWKILTLAENADALRQIIDKNNPQKTEWRESPNVNFKYSNAGKSTAVFADKVYGNFYIQNDFDHLAYSEKFLLLEDEQSRQTTLKIVCGPFGYDYEQQKFILNNWSQKVKDLSE